MDTSIIVSIVSGIGAILVAGLGFMGNKKGTLASAEQNFRDTILQENEKLRKRVDELEDENKQNSDKLLEENKKLQLRILNMESIMIKAGLVMPNESPQKEDQSS